MLTQPQIDAIRKHPTTAIQDPETWYSMLGWLICVMAVLDQLEEPSDLLLLNEQL